MEQSSAIWRCRQKLGSVSFGELELSIKLAFRSREGMMVLFFSLLWLVPRGIRGLASILFVELYNTKASAVIAFAIVFESMYLMLGLIVALFWLAQGRMTRLAKEASAPPVDAVIANSRLQQYLLYVYTILLFFFLQQSLVLAALSALILGRAIYLASGPWKAEGPDEDSTWPIPYMLVILIISAVQLILKVIKSDYDMPFSMTDKEFGFLYIALTLAYLIRVVTTLYKEHKSAGAVVGGADFPTRAFVLILTAVGFVGLLACLNEHIFGFGVHYAKGLSEYFMDAAWVGAFVSASYIALRERVGISWGLAAFTVWIVIVRLVFKGGSEFLYLVLL